MVFSPPDCYKMHMRGAGTTISSVGDTTWMTTADGSVTRSIGGRMPSPMGGLTQGPAEVPDMREMLRNKDFTVVRDSTGKRSVVRKDSGTSVTIEFQMTMPHGAQRTHATFDTKDWLLRRMKILGGPAASMETGYEYTDFHGHPMLSSVHVVMGAMGFMKMEYANYRTTKKLARDAFRVF